MADNKTLIAYVSKGGVTEEAASVIANVLRDKYGFNVDVVSLRKNSHPDITQYSNVIIGCGVRKQRVHKEALDFLEKTDFKDKKVAIFLSSLEPKEKAESKYIKRILEKYPHVKPFTTNVFGGRMKVLGRTIVDKRDLEKVKAWADELGKN